MNVDLSVSLAGMTLRNPLLPGSGPPGATLRKLRRLERAGIGALMAKTISSEPATVPRPCMAFDNERFFNIEKWSEIPASRWISEILPAMQPREVPLLVSVGYTTEDVAALVPRLDSLVDGFELSTHYGTTRPEQYRALVRAARECTDKPVFMKLSVHAGDIVGNAQACEEAGASGITAINSVGPVISIDIDKRASRLGVEQPYAWLSGPAIKPIALRAVWDISHTVEIPVIACGGVSSGRDVIEFLMAGAGAVQCCTALIRSGPQWITDTLAEIREWCAEHGVKTLRELIGCAAPHYIPSRPKS